MPAVRLQELLNLLNLDKLTDEEMVNAQRNNLLNSSSPTPSVETLLHAIIPYKFVDHTHSDAILSILDQLNSQEIIKKIYGNDALFIPYIMPGFNLAKKAKVYLEKPSLLRYGGLDTKQIENVLKKKLLINTNSKKKFVK